MSNHVHESEPPQKREHHPVRGHERTQAVIHRLARATGHLEAVKKMVEDGRDCSDVLIQLAAVQSAIGAISRIILKDHIEHCLVDAVEERNMETIERLNHAIDQLLK